MQFTTLFTVAAAAISSAVAAPLESRQFTNDFIQVSYFPNGECSGSPGLGPLVTPGNGTAACLIMANDETSMTVEGTAGTVLNTCGPFFSNADCSTPIEGTSEGSCDVCLAGKSGSYVLVTLK